MRSYDTDFTGTTPMPQMCGGAPSWAVVDKKLVRIDDGADPSSLPGGDWEPGYLQAAELAPPPAEAGA